ncbi:MAG: 2-octaprenyl-6-methoxyphenyl hydroxylase [Cellvibrionaceae bacterium]
MTENVATDSEAIETDIAIIGGGMVGAAQAALLAQANPQWRITLIETFPMPEGKPSFQPSFDDRATAIAHGSVILLQQLGIWPQLQQHGTPIDQVHVSDKGHFGGALIDRHEQNVDALGYVVPNGWIGRVLIAHLHQLANVDIVAPATVEQLQPQVGGARLQLRRGDSTVILTAQLAIIADGAQSPLRQSLGIDCQQQSYQQTAIIANIGLEKSHQGVAYERFTDQGPMALLPLGESLQGQASALVWTQPSAEAERILALSDEHFLHLLQQRFGHRLGRFVSVGKRDSYPLSLSVAKEQIRSSVVVMGNAAHFLHPVAGQGFNLALRDCAALATSLMEKSDAPLGALSRLNRYMELQRLDQQATINFSDQLTKLFSTASLPQAALRALGFVGLECVPPVKHWFTRQTMGAGGRQQVLNPVAGH